MTLTIHNTSASTIRRILMDVDTENMRFHLVIVDLGRFLRLVNPNFVPIAKTVNGYRLPRRGLRFDDLLHLKQQVREQKKPRGCLGKIFLSNPPIQFLRVTVEWYVSMESRTWRTCHRVRRLSGSLLDSLSRLCSVLHLPQHGFG